MTSAWIDTSSAETGSSATMNPGCEASARAIATRWRCPPEKARGKRAEVLACQADLATAEPPPRPSPLSASVRGGASATRSARRRPSCGH